LTIELDGGQIANLCELANTSVGTESRVMPPPLTIHPVHLLILLLILLLLGFEWQTSLATGD